MAERNVIGERKHMIEQELIEAIDAELDEHGYEDDDEKRGQVAHHFANVVINALGLTEQTNRYSGVITSTSPKRRRLVGPWHDITT